MSKLLQTHTNKKQSLFYPISAQCVKTASQNNNSLNLALVYQLQRPATQYAVAFWPEEL
jgi:hypothetical protein